MKPTSDEPTSDTVEAGSTDEPVATVVNTYDQSVEGQNFVTSNKNDKKRCTIYIKQSSKEVMEIYLYNHCYL